MNIFVCQTPFQSYYAAQVVDYLVSKDPSNNKFVVIHTGLYIDYFPKSIDIFFLDVSSKGGLFRRQKKFRNAIKFIRKQIKSNEQTQYFIPHTGGLISNYIFFSKAENLKTNFYYEGVLYLYDCREPYKGHHFKRLILGLFLGFKYVYSSEIYPYNSNKVKNIFTPIKLFTKGNESKKIEVPFTAKILQEHENTHYLILGGPINYLEEFYSVCIDEILSDKLILGNVEKRIYYKGHASFNSHNAKYKNVFKKIANSKNIKFIELDILTPIELLIDSINPKIIFSYYSSALLNIKLMSVKDINIICLMDKNSRINPNFLQVFNYYKIKIKHI